MGVGEGTWWEGAETYPPPDPLLLPLLTGEPAGRAVSVPIGLIHTNKFRRPQFSHSIPLRGRLACSITQEVTMLERQLANPAIRKEATVLNLMFSNDRTIRKLEKVRHATAAMRAGGHSAIPPHGLGACSSPGRGGAGRPSISLLRRLPSTYISNAEYLLCAVCWEWWMGGDHSDPSLPLPRQRPMLRSWNVLFFSSPSPSSPCRGAAAPESKVPRGEKGGGRRGGREGGKKTRREDRATF